MVSILIQEGYQSSFQVKEVASKGVLHWFQEEVQLYVSL